MGPKCEEKKYMQTPTWPGSSSWLGWLGKLPQPSKSNLLQAPASFSVVFVIILYLALHLAHPWAGSSIVAYPAPAMRLAFSTADGLNDLMNCCTMQLGQNCEVVRSNNCTLQARHNFLSHGRSCKNSGRFCYKIQWDSINLTPHPPTHPILMPHYPT